jgi:hypothetical protein
LTVKQAYNINYDPKDNKECYWFDKDEIEARMLQSFYASLYGEELLMMD